METGEGKWWCSSGAMAADWPAKEQH